MMSGKQLIDMIADGERLAQAYLSGRTSAPKPQVGTWKLVLVTPALAAAMLERNIPCNRKRSETQEDRWAEIIGGNEYRLTHQGAAITDTGYMADAQHRCKGIVESGVPVLMWVYVGLPEAYFKDIDNGYTRRAYQRLQIDKDTIALAGAANRISGKRGYVTDGEISRIAVRYHNAIERLKALKLPHVRGMTTAPVLWALVTYIDQYPVRGEEFARQFVTGENIAKGDPAYALRNALSSPTSSRPTGGDCIAKDRYWRTVAAMRAHLEGRTLTRIYAAGQDFCGNVRTMERHAND